MRSRFQLLFSIVLVVLSGIGSECDSLNVEEDAVGRRLLGEGNNLLAAAAPARVTVSSAQGNLVTIRTGAFPALTSDSLPLLENNATKISDQQPSPDGSKGKTYILLISSILFLFFVLLGFFLIPRYTEAKSKRAQGATLLHRLSKVFVTGVPKLERSELETACEDFSNIINTFRGCLIYKGILSTGVEIAVVSTSIKESKLWSQQAQKEFKKKIDTLSRVNHKNFVNLLGYCEEEDLFVRMMVFEYAPNGTLYERLHVKDFEHLDWHSRMRIIMGTSYCLEYMHHELNPPVILQRLGSDTILTSDDNTAKIADISFWAEFAAEEGMSDEEQWCISHSASCTTIDDIVHSFGLLLLEIITARSPSKEEGSLVNWAAGYLSDKEKHSSLVDPTLKSYKANELDAISEVIQECIVEDPGQRPTMKQVTAKLREVTSISPEAATSRISPLWWAELEILNMENT